MLSEREERIRSSYLRLSEALDEATRRRWAAIRAIREGRGGPSVVARATGLSRSTIYAGIAEIEAMSSPEQGMVRRVGGGRKPLAADDDQLGRFLLTLLRPEDKDRRWACVLWTTSSVRELTRIAVDAGFNATKATVSNRLWAAGLREQERPAGVPARAIDAQLRYVCYSTSRSVSEGFVPLLLSIHGGAMTSGNDRGILAVKDFVAAWWTEMGVRAFPKAKGLSVLVGLSNGIPPELLDGWIPRLVELGGQLGLRVWLSYIPPAAMKIQILSQAGTLSRSLYAPSNASQELRAELSLLKVVSRRVSRTVPDLDVPAYWNRRD